MSGELKQQQPSSWPGKRRFALLPGRDGDGRGRHRFFRIALALAFVLIMVTTAFSAWVQFSGITKPALSRSRWPIAGWLTEVAGIEDAKWVAG